MFARRREVFAVVNDCTHICTSKSLVGLAGALWKIPSRVSKYLKVKEMFVSFLEEGE